MHYDTFTTRENCIPNLGKLAILKIVFMLMIAPWLVLGLSEVAWSIEMYVVVHTFWHFLAFHISYVIYSCHWAGGQKKD